LRVWAGEQTTLASAWLKDLDSAAVHLVMSLNYEIDRGEALKAARSLLPLAPLQATDSQAFQHELRRNWPTGWMKQMLWVLSAYIDLQCETAVQNAALTPGVVPTGYDFQAEREAIRQHAQHAREHALIVQATQHPSLLDIRKRCVEIYEIAFGVIQAVSSGEWTKQHLQEIKDDEDDGA